MVDQNTVVHVTIGEQKVIVLGSLAVFNYVSPQSAGRIKVTVTKENGASFDREDLSEISKRLGGNINLSIISDKTTSTYLSVIESIYLTARPGFESLEIGVLRLN